MKAIGAVIEMLRRVEAPIAGIVLNESAATTDALSKAYGSYYTALNGAYMKPPQVHVRLQQVAGQVSRSSRVPADVCSKPSTVHAETSDVIQPGEGSPLGPGGSESQAITKEKMVEVGIGHADGLRPG
jgi:hypothetical protein